MSIHVELYGIVCRRAGVSRVELNSNGSTRTLGDVLLELGRQSPDFARDCLEGSRLRRGFVANQNGDRFVSDPAAELQNGDVLLIMSADAGG